MLCVLRRLLLLKRWIACGYRFGLLVYDGFGYHVDDWVLDGVV